MAGFLVNPLVAVAKVSLTSILSTLPEGQVTVESVLEYALKSNSFKAVSSSFPASMATRLRAEAPLDFRVVAKLQSGRELTKPQSLLSPDEVATQATSLGFTKALQTGTTLGGEWVNKKVQTSFSVASTGSPVFDQFLADRSDYVPELSLSLRQELLKNSFGYATRAVLTAAEKQAEIQKIQFREALKDWHFELLKTYYGAWLAKEQFRQAESDFLRQQRLFKVSENRYRLGTTEQADFLQVKVGLNLSDQRRMVTKQKLMSIWRDVVTQLELPQAWLDIEPVEIPIQLDNPVPMATISCQKPWMQEEQPGWRMARLEYEGATAQSSASKSRALPDLSIVATLKRGARQANFHEAMDDVQKGTYPATFYGLQLDWNLDSSSEKAQVIEAEIVRRKAEALLEVKRGSLYSAWQTQCEAFHRLLETQKQFQLALKDQMQRLDLEEKRFREGRTLLFQVIQAQGDLQVTENLDRQNEAELRLTAWQLLRQSSVMETMIDRFSKDQ